jgi:RNA polymerase sigma-70 factor (ECF subfamily)
MITATFNAIDVLAAQSSIAAETAEQLAARCRDGSLEPFEQLVTAFEKRIYNFLWQYTGNSHDAQDLTQETFVRAWRYIHRFDPSRDFATWIFVIARRVAANYFRARKNHSELNDEFEAAGEDPSVATEARDHSQNIWRLARKLKARQYEALWLHYAEDFSVSQTARVMGLTTIHVKVILHRARNELALHLKKENI